MIQCFYVRQKRNAMLVRFAVTNFRNFQQRIELDLTHHRDYEFNTFSVRNGIIKNGIVYGPNGSGKSNFSLAIFDIVYHLSQKWKELDYYLNFSNAANAKQDVMFEYVFAFDNYTVEYSYTKTSRGILSKESLVVNNVQKFIWQKGKFDIDTDEFPMDESVKRRFTENANGVSVINYLLASYPLQRNHYLIKFRNFIDGMLWFRNLDERRFIGLDTGIKLIYEEMIRKHQIDDFARFLDSISSQKFDFVPPKDGDKMLFCRFGSNIIPFEVIASTGTKSLALLFYWLKQLSVASFVFIDEFDAFYHYSLSFAVCKELFKRDCQIFLSSHNTYLMTNDLLRPDCNFILADNAIRPLCECTEKDLRFGHNIEKLFRGGAFK